MRRSDDEDNVLDGINDDVDNDVPVDEEEEKVQPATLFSFDTETKPPAQELAAMKVRVAEMEKEAAKLREMTEAADKASNATSGVASEEQETVDGRSIYVGNVRLRSFPPS